MNALQGQGGSLQAQGLGQVNALQGQGGMLAGGMAAMAGSTGTSGLQTQQQGLAQAPGQALSGQVNALSSGVGGQVGALQEQGAAQAGMLSGLGGQGLAQGQGLVDAQTQGLAQAQGQGQAVVASTTSSVGGMFSSMFGSKGSNAGDKVSKGKGSDGVDTGLGLGSGLTPGAGLTSGSGLALGGSLGGGSFGLGGLGQGFGQSPSMTGNNNVTAPEMPALTTTGNVSGMTGNVTTPTTTTSSLGKHHVHGENHKDKEKTTTAAASGLGLDGLAADATTGNTPIQYILLS